jgi:Exopolyphosphatase
MKKRSAVIDLGTNTCNLLIADYEQNNYEILYQGKEVVKLGKGGIDKNLLTEDGLLRAVTAITRHNEKIRQFDVSDVVVIATSAIRDAVNKNWFSQKLKEATGHELHIISGEKEAEYIFEGVKLAFDRIENDALILDIGGGSNEFILVENGNPIWKQSFPLGMARVIEHIPPSDPITFEEIEKIFNWFESGLQPLWKRLKNVETSMLIGCSGAFDTIVDMIDQTEPGTKSRKQQEIKIDEFQQIYGQLIQSTTLERTDMKGLESIRIEMIVPSVMFIKLVVEKLNITKIYQTDFALREGVLYEKIFS